MAAVDRGREQAPKEAEKKDEKGGKEKRIVVSVTGMDCATCSLAIEKQVKKVKGVKDVKTALILNKVFIDYDPNSVDPVTIKKAIDRTGYKSYKIEEKK